MAVKDDLPLTPIEVGYDRSEALAAAPQSAFSGQTCFVTAGGSCKV